MGYYLAGRGDYYGVRGRGDYYGRRGRGDLWGFIKGAAKVGGSLLTGGPLAAARTAGGLLLGGGGGTPTATSVSIQPPSIGPVQLGPAISVSRTPVLSAHATPAQVAAQLGMRRRRMNPANPKALRRALRRVQGFGALAARASADVAKANRALNRIPRKTTKKRR